MSNSENKNNRDKTLLIINLAALVVAIIALVVAIIALVVMVKTCALTEKSVEIMELQKEEKKEEMLRNANAIFDIAGNNRTKYLEAQKIYIEVLYVDSTDTTGYYKFFNKAKDRLDRLPKCDDDTEWFLERAKELTKEIKQIENINSLLKKCADEKD